MCVSTRVSACEHECVCVRVCVPYSVGQGGTGLPRTMHRQDAQWTQGAGPLPACGGRPRRLVFLPLSQPAENREQVLCPPCAPGPTASLRERVAAAPEQWWPPALAQSLGNRMPAWEGGGKPGAGRAPPDNLVLASGITRSPPPCVWLEPAAKSASMNGLSLCEVAWGCNGLAINMLFPLSSAA